MLTLVRQVGCRTRKFDRGLGQILHDELHWLDVFFKLAVTVHRCLNGRAPLYLSDYCVQLRSINRQLLAVPRYRLMVAGPFQLPALQSGTLSRILSGTQPSVQTVSGACLRRTCLLDTMHLAR